MSSRPRALRAAGFRAALASALIALVGGAVLVPTAPAVAADPDPADPGQGEDRHEAHERGGGAHGSDDRWEPSRPDVG